MKSRALICIIAAASLGASSLSFAQASGYDAERAARQGEHRGNNGRGQAQRGQNQGRNHQGNDHRGDDRRADNYRGDNHRDDHAGRNGGYYYYGARGPDWHRGGYIPRQYRSQQYVVNDWRGHHLYAPPRGHEWVQVGGDYVLIAIATGIIAQLLLSR